MVGIDLGERWIGVAVSDSARRVATPREVIERSGDPLVDRARLRGMVEEVGAAVVVVGLPLSLDGGRGPAARAALAEVGELTAALEVRVETFDERLSTAAAARGAAGSRRSSRGRLDAAAAAVVLQAWLDRRR
ncbi:MAG: Holliday junction resolvase RuvX [Acidimicrobiales bacterium]